MNPDQIFQIANMTALIGWVALLISPFIPKLADRISGLIIPALLAIAYSGLILVFFGGAEGGFDTLDNVMKLFTVREAALAGWIHYLAFDLFIGAWEVRTGRADGMPFLLVLPCLPLTFMFGPAGLLLFIVLRNIYGVARQS
ncbi:MAG TPA: ABA4-like family protein [Hyphomicrobiales bacterium]|nr:ABA4-like family protein [Hyphomicrobiales bacterium]